MRLSKLRCSHCCKLAFRISVDSITDDLILKCDYCGEELKEFKGRGFGLKSIT